MSVIDDKQCNDFHSFTFCELYKLLEYFTSIKIYLLSECDLNNEIFYRLEWAIQEELTILSVDSIYTRDDFSYMYPQDF